MSVKSAATLFFAEPLDQVHIKENIKALRYGYPVWESTADSPHKGTAVTWKKIPCHYVTMTNIFHICSMLYCAVWSSLHFSCHPPEEISAQCVHGLPQLCVLCHYMLRITVLHGFAIYLPVFFRVVLALRVHFSRFWFSYDEGNSTNPQLRAPFVHVFCVCFWVLV